MFMNVLINLKALHSHSEHLSTEVICPHLDISTYLQIFLQFILLPLYWTDSFVINFTSFHALLPQK